MKKSLRNILIGVLVVLGLARLSGGLTFYNVPTSGLEPNLKLDSRFIGSNFVKPNRLDFGYYAFNDSEFGNITIVQRLIAVPGDVLECRKGEFFVNNENIDAQLNLRRMYVLSNDEYKTIQKYVTEDESIIWFSNQDGSIRVTLDDDYVDSLNFIPIRHYNEDNVEISTDIRSKIKNWGFDNFGPITLPENKYFFVGDNRDNSMDSRSRGFINKKDVKGKLLFQF